MSHDDQKTITGDVTDIFAHRFVVKTSAGMVLADLGPKGAEQVRLKAGDQVELIGEMKPSELKVHSIALHGGAATIVGHPKKPSPHEHDGADPAIALKTTEANGFTALGQPRRKPKHFEVLGRDAGGDLVELHIELDGALRKTQPTDRHDPKWATELETPRS